ncbi:MAG: DUF445 domain-containing protein [Hyphomonadaceae bacterium]
MTHGGVEAPLAPAAHALIVMRVIATGLLVLMAALYLVALRLQGDGAGFWGYARAFAEAALVGGLADWFAVTALFRRPLGLPVPHTAIIPNSKDRIADTLGAFVADNFLSPEIIDAHLRERDLAAAVARQLADPIAAARMADGVLDAAPALADLLDDDVISDFVARQITALSRGVHLSAMIGRGLEMAAAHGRHQIILDAALQEGWCALQENESAIRARVRAQTSWFGRLISLDEKAADALIGAIAATLQEVAADPAHPARRRVTEMLHRYAADLQYSPAQRAQIEKFVADLLAHPAVSTYFAGLWRQLRHAMHNAPEGSDQAARAALAGAIAQFGRALLEEAAVRETLNRRLRMLLAEIAGRHGRDLSALISQTIKNWDAHTVVQKLEQSVGPDLQYIRISGTLIGGLIGLAIHQISLTLA